MKARSPKFSLTNNRNVPLLVISDILHSRWLFSHHCFPNCTLLRRIKRAWQLVWLYVKHTDLGNRYETWEWVSDPKCKEEQVCPTHCNCKILFEIQRPQIIGEWNQDGFPKLCFRTSYTPFRTNIKLLGRKQSHLWLLGARSMIWLHRWCFEKWPFWPKSLEQLVGLSGRTDNKARE